MTSFSRKERAVAAFLTRFPAAKRHAKRAYQVMNYYLYGRKNARLILSEGIDLSTPIERFGGAPLDRNTSEFFGYFDLSPWSPCGRYYLTHRHRDGEPSVGITLYDADRRDCFEVGRTRAWTWQQGAMAQWLPGPDGPILCYNDIEDGILGARSYCTATGRKDFTPMPIGAINVPKRQILSLNFVRLAHNGTEYGYDLTARNLPAADECEHDGIWLTDFDRPDTHNLIVSLNALMTTARRPEMAGAAHEVNHISVSPDGERFVFVHRWRGSKGQFSRLYLYDLASREMRLILDENMVSHYTWLDDTCLLGWVRTAAAGARYHLIDLVDGQTTPLMSDTADRYGDGHPTVSRDGVAVTDSYADRARRQHLLLMDLEQRGFDEIAEFHLPLKFSEHNRIDLHPRWHPFRDQLSIDAGFEGRRRNYIVGLRPEC